MNTKINPKIQLNVILKLFRTIVVFKVIVRKVTRKDACPKLVTTRFLLSK